MEAHPKTGIMDAIRSGNYYASCGPVIDDFRVEDNTEGKQTLAPPSRAGTSRARGPRHSAD